METNIDASTNADKVYTMAASMVATAATQGALVSTDFTLVGIDTNKVALVEPNKPPKVGTTLDITALVAERLERLGGKASIIETEAATHE